MANRSEAEVRAAAAKYWHSAKDVNMAVEIARIETGGTFNDTAYNGVGLDRSYGVMQINMKDDALSNYLGTARRRQFGLPNNEALYNLDTNMRVAFGIWQQNGNSFFGSRAWSTSAVAAAAKLSLTGLTGQTRGDDDSPQPLTSAQQAAYNAALAKIQTAIDKELIDDGSGSAQGVAQIIVNYENGSGPYAQVADYYIQQAGLTASDITALRLGLAAVGVDLIEGGTGSGASANAASDALNVLGDWKELLERFLGILTSASFWKRIGIGALGAVVILVAIAMFVKGQASPTINVEGSQ